MFWEMVRDFLLKYEIDESSLKEFSKMLVAGDNPCLNVGWKIPNK